MVSLTELASKPYWDDQGDATPRNPTACAYSNSYFARYSYHSSVARHLSLAEVDTTRRRYARHSELNYIWSREGPALGAEILALSTTP